MSGGPFKPDRVEALDVVRGLAVLGILPVNAAYFAYPHQAGVNPGLDPQPAMDGANALAWAVMHVGFELKMITLFSMLFGISLYLVGGERSDAERGAVLRRRLGWLALFGALHGALIWYGDILLHYALCGFIVLFLRSHGARTLIAAGVALFVASLLLQAGLAFSTQVMPPDALDEMKWAAWDPGVEEIARVVGATQGGLASASAENFWTWLDYLRFLPFYLPRTIGLMLLGLGLFKAGFFHGRAPTLVYAGLICACFASLAVLAVKSAQAIAAEYPFGMVFGPESLWIYTLSLFISLGYAAALILRVKYGSARFLTAALSNVGRLAFTNYLTQSLIMTTIFWGGRGFGLFGEVDRVGLWVIVVAIWSAQLVWSALWLRAFAMGPFEWLWRSLTMKRFERLRREA